LKNNFTNANNKKPNKSTVKLLPKALAAQNLKNIIADTKIHLKETTITEPIANTSNLNVNMKMEVDGNVDNKKSGELPTSPSKNPLNKSTSESSGNKVVNSKTEMEVDDNVDNPKSGELPTSPSKNPLNKSTSESSGNKVVNSNKNENAKIECKEKNSEKKEKQQSKSVDLGDKKEKEKKSLPAGKGVGIGVTKQQQPKKEFLNKTRYTIDRVMKFRNDSVSNNKTASTNNALKETQKEKSQDKSHLNNDKTSTFTNQTNTTKQNIRNPKTNIVNDGVLKEKSTIIIPNVFKDIKIPKRPSSASRKEVSGDKKEIFNVKSTVKEYLQTRFNDKVKNKKKVHEGNFVRLDLKKKYEEKKLVRPINMRKYKMNKDKMIEKMNNLKQFKKDTKYLGKGKDGLDDEIKPDYEEESNSEREKEKDNKESSSHTKMIENLEFKVPCFSEGYFIKEHGFSSCSKNSNSNNKAVSSEKSGKQPNSIAENKLDEQANNVDDIIIDVKQQEIEDQNANFLKHIISIVNSSVKKEIRFDTGVKKMNEEFRALLSSTVNNKQTNNCCITNTPFNKSGVEKKLNFNTIAEEIIEMEIDEVEQIESIVFSQINEVHEENNSKMAIDEDPFTDNNIYPNEEADIDYLENEILLKVLNDNFGFNTFRKGQLDLIKNILNGNNSLAILPSGLGKSLCYQLPSLVLEGVTIVVSPFLSLITDQISSLPKSLSAASLTSFTTTSQRKEILVALKENKIKILFITPERLAVENLSEIDHISMLCFDEASSCCPSSPLFRSSYVTIMSMISTKLKPSVVLLLSNNSTTSVEKYLIDKFNIEERSVVKLPINILNNIEISITKDENKINGCVSLLKSKKFREVGSTIIFCNMKRTVDKLTNYLNQNGLIASSYHSSKSENERQTIQHNFMMNKIKILVTSVGFSAGINKEDIRLVVVYDMSPNMEQLIQQIGRGGRDQKKTYVHVFLHEEDYLAQRNMIYIDNIARVNIFHITT